MGILENGQTSSWPSIVVIHTDGASRGNPGPASLGLVVYDQDQNVVYERGEPLGSQTNNYAEYMAVQVALELAVEKSVEKVVLKSDSQLLIRQLTGVYKVKSEGLRPLYLACAELAKKIPDMHFEHVRREFNKRADELANLALDT